MQPHRLEVTPALRGLMSYPKLRGHAPRVLILESRYWIDGACRRAAAKLGWEIATAPVVLEGLLSRDLISQFLETLLRFKPDFVFSVNLSGMDVGGLFAGLFEDLGVPHVTWFVDDPRTILMGNRSYSNPYSVALTWENAYAGYLRALDFADVVYLPLAADTSIFNAGPGESTHPPAFVGTAMADNAALAWSELSRRPKLAAACKEAMDAGRVTRDTFAAGLGAILTEDDVIGIEAEGERHAEMYFFIEGTRRLRHGLVQSLEPVGLQVYGSEDWHGISPKYQRPLDYESELAEFYRACEVNVNTTSIQMQSAVNQRVFDCPAAGGFLLTDRQADLETLFDADSECAVYSSIEECADKLRFYQARPGERERVVAAARRRILAEHTYEHRLHTIERVVRRLYA